MVNRSLHLALSEQCSGSASLRKRKLPTLVQADKRSCFCAILRVRAPQCSCGAQFHTIYFCSGIATEARNSLAHRITALPRVTQFIKKVLFMY